jgi:hypothetical protein
MGDPKVVRSAHPPRRAKGPEPLLVARIIQATTAWKIRQDQLRPPMGITLPQRGIDGGYPQHSPRKQRLRQYWLRDRPRALSSG